MWANGREDVCRREAQTVVRACVGRRSINSRGAEVEWSEGRRVGATEVRRLTAVDWNSRRERSEGAKCKWQYGTQSEERASERRVPDLARGVLKHDCGGAVLVQVVARMS